MKEIFYDTCTLQKNEEYKKLATQIRLDILEMAYDKKAGFIGTAFSCADILAVLYGGFLKYNETTPENPNHNTFILSKGHGASAWYATLANTGFFDKSELDKFHTSGSLMGVHPKRNSFNGIYSSSGSLGHGLALGCGVAQAKKLKNGMGKVFVLLGDGECNEGSVWESVMFANRFDLFNLTAIVDRNRLQSYGTDEKVLNLADMSPKFKSFGWDVLDIDGHSFEEIHNAFVQSFKQKHKPLVIIANTIKGKGCSLFENQVLWHYKWPETEHYLRAKKELLG